VCTSDSTRNGTCYTAEECDNKGGTSSGSCADGYGVCCISMYPNVAKSLLFCHMILILFPYAVTMKCGATASENCTYIVQESTTTPDRFCSYKLCKSGPNICRIRLDFTVSSV
jgi:hypothetical protein